MSDSMGITRRVLLVWLTAQTGVDQSCAHIIILVADRREWQ
jgi:hypothetical protein